MPQPQRPAKKPNSPSLNLASFKRTSASSRSTPRTVSTETPILRKHNVNIRKPAPVSAQPAQTPSSSSAIAPMGTAVAHQIRSAHIVLDPASVIKELLENALDAGATRIDIRVRGKAALDSITVSDNGKGVSKHDYSSLCLSASTSKITQFSDLDSVSTFGFRGEALSAICAICKSVTVVTRTAADSVATSLKYRPDGTILEQRPVARPKGTTVVVDSLFHNLPVRRKDALKNSYREIGRSIEVVQALALISVGVRIELKVTQDLKVLSQPSPSTAPLPSREDSRAKSLDLQAFRHTASCMLGKKTAASLLELPMSEIATVSLQRGLRNQTGSSQGAENGSGSQLHYRCTGLVSRASLDANGSGGRAKSCHQYIFANRRPVNFPRMTRAVNELYRRVTGMNGASPVLLINLSLPAGSHDVNLSPDKRDLLVRDESEVISGLLERLETLWAPKRACEIPLQTLEFGRRDSATRPRTSESSTDTRVVKSIGPVDPQVANGARDLDSCEAESEQATPSGSGIASVGSAPEETPQLATSVKNNYFNVELGSPAPTHREDRAGGSDENEDGGDNVKSLPALDANHAAERYSKPQDTEVAPVSAEYSTECPSVEAAFKRRRLLTASGPQKRDIAAFVAKKAESIPTRAKRPKTTSKFPPLSPTSLNSSPNSRAEEGRIHQSSSAARKSKDVVEMQLDRPSLRTRKQQESKASVLKVDWGRACIDQLPLGETKDATQRDQGAKLGRGQMTADGFRRSSMSNEECGQDQTTQAGDLEMSRLFRQEWFGELNVLGQFNRGFIICQLGRDLFIIDQHASDEKYNFEDLQRTTTISKQQLVRPLALEMSAQDELIVLQHLDAFRAGGFGIEYRANRKPTQRLYLRSQPVSKHTMFVQDDLKDMVAVLKNAALQSSSVKVGVLRPPRIRAMFASRACRKSVMIGSALQKPQMRRIVRNLTSIEHPWTCPHGRPTMRHLCTLPES